MVIYCFPSRLGMWPQLTSQKLVGTSGSLFQFPLNALQIKLSVFNVFLFTQNRQTVGALNITTKL